MRDKYIYEEYQYWFIFGENKKRGTVDISNGEGDVATDIPKDEAIKLIKEHDRIVDKLVDVALEWSESDNKAFTDYWYNNKSFVKD